MPAKKKVEEVTETVEKEVKPKKTTAKKEVKAEEKEVKKTTKKASVDTEKKTEKVAKKASATKEEKVEAPKAKKAPAKKVTKIAKDTTIQFWGTGRRKKSIARVRIMQGNGKVLINNVELKQYFPFGTLSQVAVQPIELLNVANKFNVMVNVQGGGFSGQAGAIRLGIARALVKFDETYRAELKKAGYLTRDARIKERKKYGLRKARRAVQFSK